jgi:hypothetical protein
MKLKTSLMFLLVMLLVLPLLSGFCGTAQAADRVVTGSIGVETPIGTPDRRQDDSTQFKLNVNFKNLVGPFNLFGGGLVATKKGLPWAGENRFNIGLELPIGDQGLLAYSYFERRFDLNDNRFVAGVRYNFRSGY